MIEQEQQEQDSQVAAGERAEIVAGLAEARLHIGFEGDYAGHGGNDGAQAADVYPQEQGRVGIGEAGEQHRGRHIAEQLAQEQGKPEFISCQCLGRPALKEGNLAEIAYADEEQGKEQQELVVGFEKEPAVKQGQSWQDYGCQEGEGHKVQHMQQAQGKEQQQGNDAFPRQGILFAVSKIYLTVRQQAGAQVDSCAAEEHYRGGDGKEFRGGEAVVGVDKEILGIANGSQHAAQVGGNGLPGNRGDDEADAPGFGKSKDGQGHKDDEGHIVGYEHGAEVAAEDKEAPQAPAGGALPEKPVEDGGKEATEPQPCHDAHQEQQQSQQRKVDALQKLRRLRGSDKAGEKGKEQSHRKVRIAPQFS